MQKQLVTVMGATGSIGLSTLDVIARNPDRFAVYALAAKKNVAGMFDLAVKFHPSVVVMEDESAANDLHALLAQTDLDCRVLSGAQSLIDVAREPTVTTVVAGIVGSVGLPPTLAAVKAGKRVLLANKESLVMAGKLFMDAVAQSQAVLLPVDSEHNAIFQCLPQPYRGIKASGVEKILLTASGGPFLQTPLDQLASVTVAQACAHPNWNMGKKISVDSATMMNKGLEFIEACWLFDAKPNDIEVILHPQSIIHSMVRFIDGSVVAQMGQPDMRTPIAHCLGWPERLINGVVPLDFTKLTGLTFGSPCYSRFPCLRLAIDAMRSGGTCPTALNAANEIAVDGFLNGALSFVEIAMVVENVMESWSEGEPVDLNAVIAADLMAREMAKEQMRLYQRAR